jgi:hypothetical protein
VGVGPDGKPKYKLTAKASNYMDALSFMEYLKQNSPEEIRKRIAKEKAI